MLQVLDIRKEYKTGDLVQKALDGVSLSFRDCEFVSILGPSGSGKTTLLNIIGGLDRYDSGDLIINGTSTKKYKDRDWDTYRNHSVGFIFQSYNLIPHQTVLSNVELALTIAGISKSERRARAARALEEVGLGDQLNKKPNQMSGGQMQRVAIARALVNDPEILLADEPTGALDTDTSIQVMELLKKVANDRLVIMVTHNPELAEQYSSRIVKLRDGKIIDDSDPFNPEAELEANPEAAIGVGKAAPKKQARMSFLTSLSLSFNNLLTKKGRTILTGLAGSIGIIGIALILSLSTGANTYIAKIQRDTMEAYPITITDRSFDLNSMMSGNRDTMSDYAAGGEEDDGKQVAVDFSDLEINSNVVSSIKDNNLTEFKKYLDDPNSEIHQYVGENGIVYSYNVKFKIYSYDRDGELIDTDADVTKELERGDSSYNDMLNIYSAMTANMESFMGGGSSGASNFSELIPGANGEVISDVIKNQYTLVYGTWPNDYDEIVLITNRRNAFSSALMYQLGYLSRKDFNAAADDLNDGKSAVPFEISYEDICNHPFYLVPAVADYRENENGTFTYVADDKDELKNIVDNSVKLKVVGIIRLNDGIDNPPISTRLAYTSLLTNYVIDQCNNSEIVKRQEADPETNILTGLKFMDSDDITDDVKKEEILKYIDNLSEDDKADMFTSIMMYDYEGGTAAVMSVAFGALDEQVTRAGNEATGRITDAITNAVTDAVDSAVDQLKDSLADIFKEYIENSDFDISTLIPDDFTIPTDEEGNPILPIEYDDDGNPIIPIEFDDDGNPILPTDELPNIDDLPDIAEIDWDAIIDQLDMETLARMFEGISIVPDFNMNLDLSGIFSPENFDLDMNLDNEKMAEIVKYWSENEPKDSALIRLFDQYIGNADYESNLSDFGKLNYDAPASINIYTDTFEGKDGIAASIDHYNETKEEDDQIVYTDYVAMLTSSITTIINAITYVLIAFVAISLLVSSIMIGIITNISVLERTKEIGILRALGASKRNVAQVFNAETFIIGALSGVLGLAISYLLTIPINAVIHFLVGNNDLSAIIPWQGAIILMIVSIGITILGGLSPSGKAARQDPVTALRTE